MASREEAVLLNAMMELFNRFAVVHSVNYPDGKKEPVALWMNPRAEQEFNQLKKLYEDTKKEK